MKIHRTYPQPDSPQQHIGPRERALAVFKYLLDMEPEQAAKHERFPLIVAAFKQEGRARIISWAKLTMIDGERTVESAVQGDDIEPMAESLVPLLGGTAEVRTRPFVKDGL